LPALLSKNYPTELMSMGDLVILVCRANRIWTESDQLAINGIHPLTGNKLHFIINGSQLKEVEAVIGDLPKKRSVIRKKIKNLFRFQFFSNNRI
jgi:polysaccharide biosynthesis transport protein